VKLGQQLIELLREHQRFRIAELVASERSAHKKYADAVKWRQSAPIPTEVTNLTIKTLDDALESPLLFSGLDSEVAGEAERAYSDAGHFVISNSKNHRLDNDVPLVIPEVNCDHLDLLKEQKGKGKIVTNPNCSTMALALALAPLVRTIGIEAVCVTTLQAISGAGYPGVASLDILGNIIPYIGGEEEKIETETLKILGTLENRRIAYASYPISAQCTRVPVVDGHTLLVSLRSSEKVNIDVLKKILREYRGEITGLKLPSAPAAPIHVSDAHDRPQVARDLHAEGGMAITIGRLRSCPVNDLKFVVLEHNTIRGAAGAAILNGEACVALGYL